MRENRRHHRVRMPPTVGRIATDAKAPTLECRIIDISASGACLEVSTPSAVPQRFDLHHAGSRKKCNVVWKRGYRLGVSF
jgi:hypothetical protein